MSIVQANKPLSDKDYQARDDAHTLARAKEISADEKRLKAAIKAAKDIEAEIEEDRKRIASVGSLPEKMYPTMAAQKKEAIPGGGGGSAAV